MFKKSMRENQQDVKDLRMDLFFWKDHLLQEKKKLTNSIFLSLGKKSAMQTLPPVGTFVKHVASGKCYLFQGLIRLADDRSTQRVMYQQVEASKLKDSDEILSAGTMWGRPLGEFVDGRFVVVAPPQLK